MKSPRYFRKSRQPTPEQKLDALNRNVLTFTVPPLLAAATASFVTTYNDVVIITDWLAGVSGTPPYVALLVTLFSAGVSFSLWGMSISYLQSYVTGKATAIGLGVLIYMTGMTALSSTYTSDIGLTHQSPRTMYLSDEATEYADQTRQLGGRTLEMENAATFIRPGAETACQKS
ncbi:hypothetical protein [Roseibium sp.]|uniref:hypothetical protein n=1 Tax=Roseibium sp. TaxID=1936156 RepID=UPI003B52BA95